MKKIYAALLAVPLMFTTLTTAAVAQQYDRNGHRVFYNGAYDGGRNGYYGDDRHHHYDRGYDDRYYNRQHHGGIGPGKGAAIGGAGGAALGLLFGGGAKGALIGGAAGAGIGAIAGKAHQDHVRRDSYGRPY